MSHAQAYSFQMATAGYGYDDIARATGITKARAKILVWDYHKLKNRVQSHVAPLPALVISSYEATTVRIT